jgi:hypothetical protein
MARDFITLSEMPRASPATYQRREQFEVEAVKAQHGGDVKMPELLSRLVAICPRQRQRAFSVYDRVGRCTTEHPSMAAAPSSAFERS